MTTPALRVERCACGVDIRVEGTAEAAIVAAVRLHNASPQHRGWRQGLGIVAFPTTQTCIGDGIRTCPVTIPSYRERCQFCQRTVSMRDRQARSA